MKREPTRWEMDDLAEINDYTGYTGGDEFTSEQQVRNYFATANLREMLTKDEGRERTMATATRGKLVQVHYIYGGDVCADCCERVQAIARDGQRVGRERARALDRTVQSGTATAPARVE